MNQLKIALPHADKIIAVGLDSGEFGNPPSKFEKVFELARQHGLSTVCHAGEEGPSDYITDSLRLLHVRRIDHGVRCLENDKVVEVLAKE